jgi:hypothetical protein
VYATHGLAVPARRSTPALEAMNPLQRWANSPPENEPASVMDIARAVTASAASRGGGSGGVGSGYDPACLSSSSYVDDGSGRSLFNGSSASSGVTGTSRSSGGSSYSMASSLRSAISHLSGGGGGRDSRSRRRRRKNSHRRSGEFAGGAGAFAGGSSGSGSGGSALTPEVRTFQCTFCTESFRTKHDWQRHEKSLHLSLERWACALHGPRCLKPPAAGDGDGGGQGASTAVVACAFCGLVDPDDAHIETHNYSTCVEKAVGERTFFRKDHLGQHLRLVHGVRYAEWSMAAWRVAAPPIASRCGFCGEGLASWPARVEHLAEVSGREESGSGSIHLRRAEAYHLRRTEASHLMRAEESI